MPPLAIVFIPTEQEHCFREWPTAFDVPGLQRLPGRLDRWEL